MAYTEISNQEIIITLPVEKVYPGIKEKLEEYLNHFPIKVIPVKKLSQAQNGLIHVLLKQFGDEIGYTLIEIKELMKEQFAINLYILGKHDKRYKHILEIDNITQRYVIACLKKRVCCICGKEHNEYNTIELHHWNSVASIGGYENCDGLKTPFMSLCAKHHQEFHATGKETFKNKYYIEGVWLNTELVKELKKIYKNHFKAFKEDKEWLIKKEKIMKEFF